MRGLALVRLAGEISLKSDPVRKRFLARLGHNIDMALKTSGIRVTEKRTAGGRVFLYTDDNEKACKTMARVFGVHSAAVAEEVSLPKERTSALEKLSAQALEHAGKTFSKGSFSVRARREGKHSFSSKHVEEALGQEIRQSMGLKVDLSNPDNTVFVEIRGQKAFLYSGLFQGLGGLPLGVEGKTAFIVKDKSQAQRDACLLAYKRGCDILFFYEPKAKQKAQELVKSLREYSQGSEQKNLPLEELEKTVSRENILAIVSPVRVSTAREASEETRRDSESLLPVLRPLAMLPKEKEKRVLA